MSSASKASTAMTTPTRPNTRTHVRNESFCIFNTFCKDTAKNSDRHADRQKQRDWQVCHENARHRIRTASQRVDCIDGIQRLPTQRRPTKRHASKPSE